MSRKANWTTLQQPPPWRETEILRTLDEGSLGKEETAIYYVALAYYRLQRFPEGDRLSTHLLTQAREMDDTLKLAHELSHIQHFVALKYGIQSKLQPLPVLHETDHISQTIKKTTDIHEAGTDVLAYFLDTYVNQTVVDASSKWKGYQDLYELVQSLTETTGKALASREGKRMKISVSEVNLLLRRVIDQSREVAASIPGSFLETGDGFALDKLKEMIGLEDVKAYIKDYYHFLKYQQDRKAFGFSMVDEPSLHMIMTGNPGTGKTTLARLLAEIYYELGLLDTTEVVEVNRSHLVGSYVGQSEENTMNYIKEATGGILFIDEAYSLKREGQSGNDYGQAVIDTLVSAMTSKEYGGTFAVILAGYPEEMRQFLWANPGLRSRIPDQNRLDLLDYALEELVQIGEKAALHNDFFFTEEALRRLETLIEKEQVDESFGNARSVRNIVTKTIFHKGAHEEIKEADDWLRHMKITENDMRWDEKDADAQEEAMEKLRKLTGLRRVKEEVAKLSSFVQMQEKRKRKGYPTVPIQLHSVFSGNPGTGKTTVAEIYASVLKECGLLKRGHVVVASRSDLVAGFVGQTAMKTKKKVREALGGVLFIDEAYALRGGNRDDFGREAVETLVDEMTKHNENLVVILAGYEREMKQLIESNPGLSSRFKKFFHFPDYSPDELLEMMRKLAEMYAYSLSEEAQSYVKEQLETYDVDGNGRFISNLMDETVQYHAWHESMEDMDNTLTEEDVREAWKAVRRQSDNDR